MRPPRAAVLVLVAAGAALHGQVPGPPARGLSGESRTPVLVELFTAEGCSSCPPADRLLEGMVAAQPTPAVEIVGMGEHVDYWNALGWKDRFSSSAFTDRQQAYADRLESGTIYTPQMVVDGAAVFVGSDIAAARAAVEQAAASPHGRLRLEAASPSARDIEVTATVESLPPLDPSGRADAIVALVESGLRSDVRRGENAGRTLMHAAVVRLLTVAGTVRAAGDVVRSRMKLGSDWNRDRMQIVAFVQVRESRRVLATVQIPAAPPSVTMRE
jgi:hypothetical protein